MIFIRNYFGVRGLPRYEPLCIQGLFGRLKQIIQLTFGFVLNCDSNFSTIFRGINQVTCE